jgi:hypothetical protein
LAVVFADEAATFVVENQQEVDFSAERLDNTRLASEELRDAGSIVE